MNILALICLILIFHIVNCLQLPGKEGKTFVMAVYFDHKVEKPVPGPSVDISWHSKRPLVAVASRGDGGGGFIHIYWIHNSEYDLFSDC